MYNSFTELILTALLYATASSSPGPIATLPGVLSNNFHATTPNPDARAFIPDANDQREGAREHRTLIRYFNL